MGRCEAYKDTAKEGHTAVSNPSGWGKYEARLHVGPTQQGWGADRESRQRAVTSTAVETAHSRGTP